MNKTNNKTMVSSLIILAILAFGAIFVPTKANAQYQYYYNNGSVVQGYNNPTNLNQPYYPDYQPVNPAPVVTQTSTVYSNSTNPNQATPAPKAAAKAKTASPAVSSNDTYNGLAANAIFGANSFMPTGLIQWLLFAILILLLIILVRKISGATKNYHSTPLKHD